MLHIVSIGHRAAFVPHLRQCGLFEFFDDQRIWGQDCEELRREGFVKGRLIAKIMASSGWTHADVLFVDDSKDHIEKASDVCRTLLVNKGIRPSEPCAQRLATRSAFSTMCLTAHARPCAIFRVGSDQRRHVGPRICSHPRCRCASGRSKAVDVSSEQDCKSYQRTACC